MKAKKMLALLLSGAMALTIGVMSACDPGNNNPGGNTDDDGGGGGGGGNYTVDTKEYHLVGDGYGDLKSNGWTPGSDDLKLVRDEKADHNVFSITIDMYQGDAFQILEVGDTSYATQMGITYMEGVDEENKVYDANENLVFKGEGMFGKDIALQEGQDGKYTFSLHTYPDGEKDAYISYVKVGDLDPRPPEADMYVLTDKNELGWIPDFSESGYHMTQNGNVWTYILTIEEEECTRNADGDVIADLPAAQDEEGEAEGPVVRYTAVAVMNDVNKQIVCDTNREPIWSSDDGWEYNLLPAGVYTLKYKVAEKTLTITDGAFALYFIGSFNNWNQDVVEEDMLTENDDGTWTGYLTITEDDYVEGKNFAEVKLFDPLGNGWYSVDGNNMELAAGTYFFKFTTETKAVAYEQMAYYVIGSFTNEEGNADDDWNFKLKPNTSVKLDKIEDGVASGVVEFTDVSSKYDWVAPGVFAFKVVYGTYLGGARDWYGDGGNNVLVPAAGEYTVSMNLETLEITLAPVVHEKTVTFDLNYEGATGAPEAQTVTVGETATEPTEPTREDYTFYGWYLDEACTEKYDFSTPVTEDITLYARWILTSSIPESVKVTFDLNYVGAPEATEADTVNGLVAKPADPEREGHYFLGWYDKAEDGELFDFDALVEEETTVYAYWRAIDAHVYHIVGSLKSGEVGNWELANETLKLEHDPAYPTANVFTIKNLLLFAGDEFKIAGTKNDWNNYLAGAGCLRGGNGELAGNNNIEVKVSGYYTISLKTDGNWEITWTVEELGAPNDMYFSVNGEEGEKLSLGSDGNWTGYITVTAEDTVKLIDKYDNDKEYAVEITEAGEYIVKFNVEDSTVEAEKLTYWVVGSFIDESGAVKNFVIVADLTPKMVLGEDGTYTVEVEIIDVTTNPDLAWVAKEGPEGAIFAIQVVYGSAMGGVKTWGNGNTYAVDGAGTYTVTYDAATKTTTLTKKVAE